MDAMLPHKLAEIEHQVVMSALRDAIDTVVNLSMSDAKAKTEITLNQVVVLKRMVEDLLSEGDEMLLMLRVVEQRLMEMN